MTSITISDEERLKKTKNWYDWGMAKQLVSEELWQNIEPLLPPEPKKPKGGRPRVSNRAALISFHLFAV